MADEFDLDIRINTVDGDGAAARATHHGYINTVSCPENTCGSCFCTADYTCPCGLDTNEYSACSC
jgi:hypothetical protein